MNNEFSRPSRISAAALSRGAYFSSLLAEALRQGMIDPGFVDRARADILALLKERLMRYTREESSSAPIAVVNQITQSILYTLGVRLMRAPDPDSALDALRRLGTATVYRQGLEQLRRMVTGTEIFYRAMLPDRMHNENLCYNATLFGGIAGFFKLYDPEFAAQEIHITADYPVCGTARDVEGILFIRSYLEAWQLEDRFCLCFDGSAVARALAVYALHYGESVRDLMGNLFLIVLGAACACVLGDGAAETLALSKTQMARARARLDGGARLSDALPSLFRRLSMPERVMRYVQQAAKAHATDCTRIIGVFAGQYT